jgi:6-phosphogluconolactonase (cycloisomerase 2 family)
MTRTHFRALTWIAAASVAAAAESGAFAQATIPAIFTANNGNLEGSVTSYTLNPDNSLQFLMKHVVGSTPSSQNPVPGTNCYAISLTPSGRYLAVSHATEFLNEQITILKVNADATIEPFAIFQTPGSALDVEWVTDDLLAVTSSPLSGNNYVICYQFDDGSKGGPPSLSQADYEVSGLFTTSLAVHPSRQYIYAQDSSGTKVTAFEVDSDGELVNIGSVVIGIYPLGLGMSPDGTRLYAGGGISGGGHAVSGFHIDPDSGTISLMAGSPYTSPGSSPKAVTVSSDNQYALVAHGTDSTVRVMGIDGESGALTDTGFMFDIGAQGSLGEVAVLQDLVFMCDRDTISDGVRGLRSFTLGADGSLTQNGTIVDTQGTVGPNALAVWKPQDECIADIAPEGGDNEVNIDDLFAIIKGWGGSDPILDIAPPGGDGLINIDDLFEVIASWGGCG